MIVSAPSLTQDDYPDLDEQALPEEEEEELYEELVLETRFDEEGRRRSSRINKPPKRRSRGTYMMYKA